MRQPSCVLWALTKHNSCFKRQAPGTKARNECWSVDPLNLTGFHNAADQGFTTEDAIGLSCEKAASKSGKGFRREYTLKVNHKSYHKTARVTKNAAAGLNFSSQTIKKGTAHAAKSIQGLTFANDAKKQQLLKRLGRLHYGSRDIQKNAPKSK